MKVFDINLSELNNFYEDALKFDEIYKNMQSNFEIL